MLVGDSGPHIQKLEDELELARQRIADLEAALGLHDDLAPFIRLGLTKSEARVVNLLCKRSHVTDEQILIAVYADDPERRFDVQRQIAKVYVCRARQKLRHFGVTFVSARDGYLMSGADRARLARLIASGARLIIRGDPKRRHYRTAKKQVAPRVRGRIDIAAHYP